MRTIVAAALCAAVCLWGSPVAAGWTGEPPVTADAAVVIDFATGTILYEKRAHQQMHPASVTKMMTAVLALERGYDGDVVTVSEYAAYTPGSCVGLPPGSRFLLGDLVAGLMLVSGNDAAVAIAEHLAGSEADFVRMMNEKAREIGAVNTTFTNPHGLTDPGHTSTAYDLALIARYGLGIPGFRRLVASREGGAWRLDRLSEVALYNTNRLLGSYMGADGVKTGTTEAAGACLCASATRDDNTFISVVLHSDDRWRDAADLLDWAFAQFEQVVSMRKGDPVGSVPVSGGMKAAVAAVAAADLGAVVRKGDASTLSLRLELDRRLRAPVRRGDRVGQATLWTSQGVVASIPLAAAEDIDRWSALRAAGGVVSTVIRAMGLLGIG